MKKIKRSLSLLLVTIMLLSTVSMLGVANVSAADADLTISAVNASDATLNIETGMEIPTYLYATVRNSGTVATNTDVSVSFYVDNRFFESVTYSTAIESGGLAIIQSATQKNLFFGSHSVRAVVSYAGDTYEADNKLKTRLTVYDATYYPIPDLTPPRSETVITAPSATRVLDKTGVGDVQISSDKQNAFSSGAISHANAAGEGANFTYNAPSAGYYSVRLRCSNGTPSDHPRKTNAGYSTVSIGANGTTGGQYAFCNSYNEFISYGYWDSWEWSTPVRVQLNAGVNTIEARIVSGDANIDCIEVTPGVAADYFTSFKFLTENNPQLDADIVCKINVDGTIVAQVPTTVDPTELIATYETVSGVTSVTVMGKQQESGVTKNDFTNGHEYVVEKSGNATITYKVIFDYLSDNTLPIAYVEFDRAGDTTGKVTEENINKLLNSTSVYDKENNKVPCYFTVVLPENLTAITTSQSSNPDKYTELYDAPGECSIRGNSTLQYAKKAWKIKLESKSKVLDMPKSKHWILLANSCDKTSLRQYMGYELGRVLSNQGLGYSPDTRFAHVYFDGAYKGLYLLMEQIKVDSKRLDIYSAEEFKIDNIDGTWTYPEGTDYTGGYLIEIDRKLIDDPEGAVYEDWRGISPAYQAGGGNIAFALKDPGDLSSQHVTEASNQLVNMRNAINSNNWSTIQRTIDVDSFVDWYIILEIMKSGDADWYSSIYLTKVSQTDARMQYTNQAEYDADQALPEGERTGVELEANPRYEGPDGVGKFYMGPIWDFDISSGNSDWPTGHSAIINTDGWLLNEMWWGKLKSYSEFQALVKARYTDLRTSGGNIYCDILGMLDNADSSIQNANNDNFTVWQTSLYAWPNPIISNNAQAYDNQLRNWLSARLSWLDNQWLNK